MLILNSSSNLFLLTIPDKAHLPFKSLREFVKFQPACLLSYASLRGLISSTVNNKLQPAARPFNPEWRINKCDKAKNVIISEISQISLH